MSSKEYLYLFGFRPLLSRTVANTFILLSSTELRHVLLLETLEQIVFLFTHVYTQLTIDFSLYLTRSFRSKFGKTKCKKSKIDNCDSTWSKKIRQLLEGE